MNERQTFYKELIKVKHGGVINFPPPPTAELIPGGPPMAPNASTPGGQYPAQQPQYPSVCPSTVYRVHCIIHYTVNSMQCILYSVYCTVVRTNYSAT